MEQKQVFAAFVAAQKAFGPALKSSSNPHFKSKYADLAACVEAVVDALNDNGIGLIQRTLPTESGVSVETLFVHTSGESFGSGPFHVPAAKNDPQGYGSALTYARRYSLMAACGIAPEDDDGNAASKGKGQSAPKRQAPRAGVMADVLASLPPLDAATAAYFDELAAVVIDAFDRSPVDAFGVVEAENLENEQKLHLSSRLPSNVRAALKVISVERNKPKEAP